MTECLGQPRGAGQHRGDTRRQPQRFLQLGVGGRPVPVVGGVKPAEPCMRLTRFWVEPDCSLKTAARSLVGLNQDRKSTRLNSSHLVISYAVFCLKKKKKTSHTPVST